MIGAADLFSWVHILSFMVTFAMCNLLLLDNQIYSSFILWVLDFMSYLERFYTLKEDE